MGKGSREFMDWEGQVRQKSMIKEAEIENITDGDYIESVLCLEITEMQGGK